MYHCVPCKSVYIMPAPFDPVCKNIHKETDYCGNLQIVGSTRELAFTGCDHKRIMNTVLLMCMWLLTSFRLSWSTSNYSTSFFHSDLDYTSDSPCASRHLYLSICPHVYCSFTPGNLSWWRHLPSDDSNQGLSDFLCDKLSSSNLNSSPCTDT